MCSGKEFNLYSNIWRFILANPLDERNITIAQFYLWAYWWPSHGDSRILCVNLFYSCIEYDSWLIIYRTHAGWRFYGWLEVGKGSSYTSQITFRNSLLILVLVYFLFCFTVLLDNLLLFLHNYFCSKLYYWLYSINVLSGGLLYVAAFLI